MSSKATPAPGGLREQRRAVGLSQQRLAELANCSLSAIRLFERGYQPDPSAVRERVEAILSDPSTSEAAGDNRGFAKSAGAGDGRNGP